MKRNVPEAAIPTLTTSQVTRLLQQSHAKFDLVLDRPCPRHAAAPGASCFGSVQASTGQTFRNVCPARIRKDLPLS